MRTVLRNLSYVVTFDDDDRELLDADILVDGSAISAIGHELAVRDIDQEIDGRGMIALPGLVNAHQHLYQAALRALPKLERSLMGPWLDGIGARSIELWKLGRFSSSAIGAVARAVLLESLLGGITTTADQHYFFPAEHASRAYPPSRYIEEIIETARGLGVRLHAGRGTITLGRSRGGAADDRLVEDVDSILRHSESLIDHYHDPARFAHIRIALAPCGVHVDSPEMFEAFAELAERRDVRLHTHLYEQIDTAICFRDHGMSPWEFLEHHGWANNRAWVAHFNAPSPDELPRVAEAGVGIVHLIGPDLRLGWGLAPIRSYLDAGLTVGFGTTGSASNDGSNVLGDVRVAALAHRMSSKDPERWPSARELLRMATRGSAAALGRDDLGALAVGRAADVACWDLRTVDRIGIHDPVVGLVLAGLSDIAKLVMVDGVVLVNDGRPTMVDAAEIARAARAAIGLEF